MERRASDASNVSQKEEITSLPYYHDQFNSTDQVAEYIRKKAKKKPGHFLLRPSNRRRNLLTASVLVPDQSVRHTHIQIERNGIERLYFLVVEKKFTSISELIEYYGTYPVKNLEGVADVFLRNPIFRDGTIHTTSELQQFSNGRLPSRTSSITSLDHSSAGPPPLPVRPRYVSSSSSFDSSSHASDGMDRESAAFPVAADPLDRADKLANRPPAPLPVEACMYSDEKVYYSRARNVDEDLTDRLKEVLKQSERCECGIARDMGELPLGWTVHRSKDVPTYGRLFYQSAEGVTSWALPEEVKMQLNQKHMSNLRKLQTRVSTSRSASNLTIQQQQQAQQLSSQRSITQL